MLEKGLDLESYGAIGQSDIRQYYDSIDLQRVFVFLMDHGLPAPVAAACLRQQLLSHVDILIGVSKLVIPSRTIGSLTGSRLAGLASRVPVQDLCCSRQRHWERFAHIWRGLIRQGAQAAGAHHVSMIDVNVNEERLRRYIYIYIYSYGK